MRPSKIKAKLKRGEPVLLTTLHFTDPSAYEMTSLMGFDGIWLDLEHHGTSLETASTLMRAARVGSADVMVRPAKGEFMRMGRILEAGAQGIMYPRCDNAEEARQLVTWAKFAPMGKRGIDSANADNPYCMTPLVEYLRAANDQTFLVAQIEDPDSLSQVDAIAAVEGIDVLFLGPGDFSILAGVPGQWEHPLVEKAVTAVADAARKSGKAWGMPALSLEHGKKILSMGAKFICYGSDIITVKQGLEAIQKQFAPLGLTFGR